MILYADCGNTAIKLALGDQRVRLLRGDVPAWLQDRDITSVVLLPGGPTTTAWLRAAVGSLPIRTVGDDLPLPDQRHYDSLGLDRRVAALALDGPAIVIDAGTATTLTAWKPAPHRFAGGLILPGVHALIAGLVATAPALPRVDPLPPGSSAAQHSTVGAIAAGAGIGHPAMVAACLSRLRHETGILHTVITGGGAEALLAAGFVAEHRPFLVLDGLQRLVSPTASARS